MTGLAPTGILINATNMVVVSAFHEGGLGGVALDADQEHLDARGRVGL